MNSRIGQLLVTVFVCSVAIVWLQRGYAQTDECSNCRYTSSIFDSVLVDSVKFGKGVNADGQMEELHMDVYRPEGDTASARPVFIFAFGGGFVQGSRDDGYVVRVCRKLAETGYVAAAIDYRTGIDLAAGATGPVEEFMRVFFRPMQDMRGAIQYFKAHADTMGNTFNVDTNRIIVGGGSAGAITALNVAYADSAEYAEIGDMSALDNLGSFRSTSGLYDGYEWDDISAVFNVAGAMVKADWVDSGDAPLVSAHGNQDNVVPYRGGNFGIGPFTIGLEGSFLIDSIARERGVCSYLYTLDGVGHPSGSTADIFINEFVNRAVPRMQAIIEGQTFCCDLGVNIAPPANDTVEEGETVDLAASMVNDTGNAQLHWCSTPCDFYSQESEVTVQPTPPNFYLAVADQGNCQASDFVAMFKPSPDTSDTTGVYAIDGQPKVSIHPNPATDRVNIERERATHPAKVTLMDLVGRTHRVARIKSGQRLTKLEVGNMAEGVYLLQLNRKHGQRITRKLVIR